MPLSKAKRRPSTDGSPVKVPTSLLWRNGAVVQIEMSDGTRW